MAAPSSDHKQGDVAVKDDRISHISSSIRIIPDSPIPGIMFQDITTIKDTVDLFVERYKEKRSPLLLVLKQEGSYLILLLHWPLGQNLFL